jgi:hypothetical protein
VSLIIVSYANNNFPLAHNIFIRGSESGACGPTFNVPGISAGFSVVTVSGPVEVFVICIGKYLLKTKYVHRKLLFT